MVARALIERVLARKRDGFHDASEPEVDIYVATYKNGIAETFASDVFPPFRAKLKRAFDEYGQIVPVVWTSNQGHSLRLDLLLSIFEFSVDDLEEALQELDATEASEGEE